VRRPLYFVYSTDAVKLKPAIKAFLDFVKGPEGQKILAGL
jgi:ABC-type phosphate transport system substrate-binding protein